MNWQFPDHTNMLRLPLNIRKHFKRRVNGIVVLMYHRVSAMNSDPWQIAVSPENFEEQIRTISNEFEIISSAEIIHRVQQGNFNQRAVCITFDDAYADNFHAAFPVLNAYHCPATFFVPSKIVRQKSRFWWDELEFLLLHDDLMPRHLELTIRHNKHRYDFLKEEVTFHESELQKSWTYEDPFPTERCKHFYSIWELLRPLSEQEISDQLNYLALWSGRSPGKSALGHAMGCDDLLQMAANPAFTIGVHTSTHVALSLQSKEIQEKEIADCKFELEELLHHKISTIAYPYGMYDKATLRIVRELQFDSGFTTEARNVGEGSDPLMLGRFQVTNVAADVLKKQIGGWMS